jgi:hypothetical protein
VRCSSDLGMVVTDAIDEDPTNGVSCDATLVPSDVSFQECSQSHSRIEESRDYETTLIGDMVTQQRRHDEGKIAKLLHD